MEDFSGPVSTTLDPGAGIATTAGGGAPPPEAPSVRDAVAAAVKETSQPEPRADAQEPVADADTPEGKAPEDKGAEKPKEAEARPEEKKGPERGEGGKFKAAEAKESDAADGEPKPVEGKEPNKQAVQGLSQAPKNFLPDAKEKWANTPRSVQRDVENMIREAETRETQHREATERYERIRPYDELARSNGWDLTESLQRVHHIENIMAKNPLAGLNAILMEIGPRKADGQPVSLFEVAQHIVQSGPEGYQRMVQMQPQQQEAQPNRELEEVRQQLADMQRQQLAQQIIEPFKATHPRYDELQQDIAFFLSSGKIPQSLSHTDRLAAAYDMAERINPASHVPDAKLPGPGDDETGRADNDSSGLKSIRSAPGSATSDEVPDRGGSIREVLERAIRTQRRA